MDAGKIIHSNHLDAKQLTSVTRFLINITFFFLLFARSLNAHQSVKDIFYLPDINCRMTIDGSRSEAAWQVNSCNWFTFGARGFFQVTAYGFFQNDSLYLAFRIEDGTLNEEDRLYICIDPNNSGDPQGTNNNSLKRYMIKRNGNTTYSYRNTTDNHYILVDTPTPTQIQSAVREEIANTYWEIEVKINRNYVGINNIQNIGLYFQVIDFHVQSNDYREYWWPITAHADSFDYTMVPYAIEWANCRCLIPQGTMAPKPDIFFSKDDAMSLRTGNANNLTISCNQPNSIYTRVRNGFLYDNNVTAIPLTFDYAKFGAGCFTRIGDIRSAEVSPNQSLENRITWTPACSDNQPVKVTLRVEHNYTNDAITSNNVMINNMNFRIIDGGNSFSVPVTISNCSEEVELALMNSPERIKTNDPMVVNSPATSLLSSNQPELFYIYFNRSLVDTTGGKREDWQISFSPLVKGDTLYPKPDPASQDIYIYYHSCLIALPPF